MKIKKKRKQNVLIDSYVKVSHRGDFTELHRCYLHSTLSPQVWQHTHLNVRIGEWWNFFSRKNQYQNTKLIVKKRAKWRRNETNTAKKEKMLKLSLCEMHKYDLFISLILVSNEYRVLRFIHKCVFFQQIIAVATTKVFYPFHSSVPLLISHLTLK